MLIPYMKKFTKENEQFKEDFKNYVIQLIEVFCELLKKVDISFFSLSRMHNSAQDRLRPDQ